MRLWIRLLACAALLGCASDDDTDDGGKLPEPDCDQDAPTYDDVDAFDKCTTCHDSSLDPSERRAAPANINFDTYEGAEAYAMKAAEEVRAGRMPPKNSGVTLTASEQQTLYEWAMCGAME